MLAIIVFAQSAAFADPRVTFDNSVAPLPAPVAATQRQVLAQNAGDIMEFGVALKMRNFALMQERIAHGDIISRDELERVFLPLQADYDAVVQWLTQEGFRITTHDPSRLVVYAEGSVTQIAKSMQLTMNSVTYKGTQYHAAVSSPSLPLSIATPVLGLNHLQPFRQRFKRSVMQPLTSNSPPYLVGEIMKAYNGLGLGVTGANQKIAILIDTTARNSDLTSFWTANGIAQSTGNIENINVNGGTLPSPSGEETLDVEWTSGVAPGAVIRVYASRTLSDANLDKCLQRMINDLPTQPKMHQLSISLGLGETYITSSQLNTDAQLFATLAGSGVSIFVSSGDNGSTPDDLGGSTGPLQVESYASDPSVTGVGGTSLTLNSSTGLRSSETVWSGSGGGVSGQFSRPAWQTGSGVPAGTKRCVPDVCLVADPNTGGYVYLGGVQQYGGTSWSAPVWAGFCALVNEARANQGKPPLGLLNPNLYPLIGTSSFTDITSGSNATSVSGGLYAAGPGYDQATGIGAPNMSNLLNALVSVSQGVPTISGFTPSSGVQNTTVTITGTNFANVTAVSFNGVNAIYAVNSTSQITTQSPAGATSGPISVTTSAGTATSSSAFTVVSGPPVPSITGFSPAYGLPGSSVTISGSTFTGVTQVSFNGTPASFVINASNQLTATVPVGASTGPIRITNSGGTASSLTSYQVLSGDGSPTITSFSPVSGAAGLATAVILGTNFVSVGSVTFNGVAASFTVDSQTQITASVPAGATTGPIRVATTLGTATSAAVFTVDTLVVLGSWDVHGLTNYGDSPLTPSYAQANLNVGGLTRGPGVTTVNTAALRAWGGTNFHSTTSSTAITNGEYMYFTVTAQAGYRVSFNSISQFDYRRASTGATSGLLQYQVGSGSFVTIGSLSYSSTSGFGASLGAIDLSGFSALQSVAPGTTITFRIVNYGASTTGGAWYIYDKSNSTAADFELKGVVTPIITFAPDMTVSMTHTGSFKQTDTGRNYTLTVSNAGTTTTTGTVSLATILPSGLTPTALTGSGWSINLPALTASRSDALVAGASYTPLTLTVNVAANAASLLTPTATVSGGGEVNSGNDSTSDPTSITPLSPSEAWRWQYFGTINNSGNAGDLTIMAGDGLTNLMKYALGLPPLTSSTLVSKIAAVNDAGVLRLTVNKSSSATDVSFIIEGSSDLTNWSTNGIVVDSETLSQLQAHDTVGGSRRFLRLKISR